MRQTLNSWLSYEKKLNKKFLDYQVKLPGLTHLLTGAIESADELGLS